MDQTLAAHVIGTQFPELEPVRTAFLGAGYDSDAFDVNDEWVFRFPRRDDVDAQLLIERAALPALAGALPAAVPVFRFHGEPTSLFPRHFSGYKKLPGMSALAVGPDALPVADLGAAIGRFLSALHSIPVEAVLTFGVPCRNLDDTLAELRAEALEDLETVRKVAPRGTPVDAWRAYLESGPGPIAPVEPAVLHNDFSAEHVLLDPDTHAITGVLDWSEIAIGHPVADLAGVFHWGGPAFFESVLASYGRGFDRANAPAAHYLAACRGAADVVFGVERHRPDYVRAGLRALAWTAPI